MAIAAAPESPSIDWLWSRTLDIIALAAIALLAIALRLPGVFHGTGYHPDERHMAMVTNDLVQNGMNPKSFAYGSFSFYAAWILARAIAPFWEGLNVLLEPIAGHLPPDPTSYDGLFVVGRLFCLAMATVAIILTYYLAILLYRRSSVGLVATFLLASNVFHIQLSKYFTSDIPLTTLAIAAVVALVRAYQDEKLRWYLTFGACAGLATATKISSIFLAVPLALVVTLVSFRSHDIRDRGRSFGIAFVLSILLFAAFWLAWWVLTPSSGVMFRTTRVEKVALLIPLLVPYSLTVAAANWRLSQPIAYAALAIALGDIVFIASEPFAILDYATFVKHTQEQTSMVRGNWRPPYTIQYEHTVPYFYHLKQMLWYTVGWPVFIPVVLGSCAAFCRTVRDLVRTLFCGGPGRSAVHAEILPVTFVVVFFVTTAGFQVKFPRYLLPLYPFLCLFAATLLVSILPRALRHPSGSGPETSGVTHL